MPRMTTKIIVRLNKTHITFTKYLVKEKLVMENQVNQ